MCVRYLLLLLAFLAGCPIDPDQSAAAEPLGNTLQAADRRMHDRLIGARRIEEAIVHGDLDRAQVEAHAIAVLDEHDALPAWQPYFESVRGAAHEIEQATNPASAARSMAELGRRCARCHQASTARVTFPKEDQPPHDKRLATQMFAHQWAAAQMWQGLIAPSDKQWNAGATALAKAPLAIVAEGEPALGIGNDIARVRLYANRALRAAAPDDRVAIYGDLLATCTHCHATIRDR